MKKLRSYINTLSFEAQEKFARACDTTIGYLRKALSVQQKLRPTLCVAIERATDGKVTRKDLRPDWDLIWPELAAPSLPYSHSCSEMEAA